MFSSAARSNPSAESVCEADVGRAILRVRRLERREPSDVAHVRRRGDLLALRPEHALEPPLAHAEERLVDGVAGRGEHGLEVAQRDLLLVLVARDRIRLLRQVRVQLLVRAQELEPLLVELGRPRVVELAELVALLVVGEHGELREGGAERQLLAVVGHPRGEDRVLELVVPLGQLGRDQTALARLAQAVEPFLLLAVGTALLLAEGDELLAAEEIRVARDDRGLLGDLLLAHADGPSFLRALEQVALEVLLELRRAAHRSRRHRENSIQPSARLAPLGGARCHAAARA